MRRAILAALLALLACSPAWADGGMGPGPGVGAFGSGMAAPGLGQNTNNSAFVGTSGTLVTPNPSGSTVTGSTLLIMSLSEGTCAASGGCTVHDTYNAAGSWSHTITDTGTGSAGDWYLNVWTCQNCTGGANDDATLAAGATTGISSTVMQFLEITGAGTSSLDQHTSSTATGGPTFTSPSITPSIANELILAIFATGVGSDVNLSSPTNGYTAPTGGNAFYPSVLQLSYAYLQDSGTSSTSTTVTIIGTSGYGYSRAILSFEP